tara:strand:+ start:761 stop:1381 length:621 start_codon:yes stop_codon:yes gene_type:complete
MEILEYLKNEDLFLEWYERYQDSDNFDEYIWLSDERREELEEELKEGLEGEKPEDFDKLLEEKVEEERERLAEEWLEDRLYDLIFEMEKECKILGDSIELSRRLTVEDISKFVKDLEEGKFQGNYNGVGLYWSWNHSKSEAHWAGEGVDIEIKALVKIKDIRLKESILKNLCPSLGEDEAEIYLEEGTSILITEIDGVKKNIESYS